MGPTGKPRVEVSNDDHRLQWVKNQMIAGAIPGDPAARAARRLNGIQVDGPQAEVAARKRLATCLRWIDVTGANLGSGRLDDLISTGTSMWELLQVCQECLALEPSWTDIQGMVVEDYSRKYDEWLGRWQRARTEADAVGLDGSISYDYWEQNIQLPEDVTKLCKWFATAQGVIEAAEHDDADRLTKFALDGHRRLVGVVARQESWPRTRRNSIQRRLMRLYHLKTKWETKANVATCRAALKAAAADRTSPGLMRVNGRIVNINKMKAATDQWNESGAKTQEGYDIVADWKEKFRDYRAKQRIKRTCAVCGETAPLSSHAFAYCGGCRHASIPRVDRPRYCSEACQRAHWAAGHMHECPRADAQQDD